MRWLPSDKGWGEERKLLYRESIMKSRLFAAGALGLIVGYFGGYFLCAYDSIIVDVSIMDFNGDGIRDVAWEKNDGGRRALLLQEDGTYTPLDKIRLYDILDSLGISDGVGVDSLQDSLKAQVRE